MTRKKWLSFFLTFVLAFLALGAMLFDLLAEVTHRAFEALEHYIDRLDFDL